MQKFTHKSCTYSLIQSSESYIRMLAHQNNYKIGHYSTPLLCAPRSLEEAKHLKWERVGRVLNLCVYLVKSGAPTEVKEACALENAFISGHMKDRWCYILNFSLSLFLHGSVLVASHTACCTMKAKAM